MPLYEYECEDCGSRFEQIQKFSDPPLEVCPKCGRGPVQKLMSPPAIQFKGSGWYITDYARKDGGSAPSADGASKTDGASSSNGSSGTKTEAAGAATETKTDAKPSTP
jgi:putative FmdB family regulatory protein